MRVVSLAPMYNHLISFAVNIIILSHSFALIGIMNIFFLELCSADHMNHAQVNAFHLYDSFFLFAPISFHTRRVFCGYFKRKMCRLIIIPKWITLPPLYRNNNKTKSLFILFTLWFANRGGNMKNVLQSDRSNFENIAISCIRIFDGSEKISR